jgi:histidinol dehydrogenase
MPIRIYDSRTIKSNDYRRIFERSSTRYETVVSEIQSQVRSVQESGDAAIFSKYQQREIPVTSLLVDETEFEAAEQQVSSDFLKALTVAQSNITSVCVEQKKSLSNTSRVDNQGVSVWREWRPLDSVGLYVPGGKANYPSSLLMSAIPALVAGCKTIIVCTPPNQDGKIPNELLVAAKEIGINTVFKIGGAQAIAAMAYGTKSVPKVLKIVGPGNQYVTAAKLSVYPNTAIDLPAGPSENLIIADENANPSFVAADLITDLEHGPDSTGVLITTSERLAKSVQQKIQTLIKKLPTKKTILASLENYGAIIVTPSLNEAIRMCNDYAPEHLQIMVNNPLKVLPLINNAGSVFLGPYSAKAAGDYCTGANHVLPTGQAAKTTGPLAVDSFGKWLEVQEVTKTGFQQLSKTIEVFADVEKLPAHKLSSMIRRST